MYTVPNFEVDAAKMQVVKGDITSALQNEFGLADGTSVERATIELTREFLINLSFMFTSSSGAEYYGKYIIPFVNVSSPAAYAAVINKLNADENNNPELIRLQNNQPQSCQLRSEFKDGIIKLLVANDIRTRSYHSFNGSYKLSVNKGYLFVSVKDNIVPHTPPEFTQASTFAFLDLLNKLEQVDPTSVMGIRELYQLTGVSSLIPDNASEVCIMPSTIARSLYFADNQYGLILNSHIELLPKRFKYCLLFIYVYNKPVQSDIATFCSTFGLDAINFEHNLADFGSVLPEWRYLV